MLTKLSVLILASQLPDIGWHYYLKSQDFKKHLQFNLMKLQRNIQAEGEALVSYKKMQSQSMYPFELVAGALRSYNQIYLSEMEMTLQGSYRAYISSISQVFGSFSLLLLSSFFKIHDSLQR